MTKLSFGLHDWSYWTQEQNASDFTTMPTLLRRRINPLGQQTLYNALHLKNVANSRIILSSRHADIDRTVSILESLAQHETVSPADFSLSGHHVLAGLLSIVQKNPLGHTSMASGSESLCFGLMEAAACLSENPDEQVLLIHNDQPLIKPFDVFDDTKETIKIIVFALGSKTNDLIFQSMTPNDDETTPSQSHTNDFVSFLKTNAAETISVGTRHNWQWTRNATH